MPKQFEEHWTAKLAQDIEIGSPLGPARQKAMHHQQVGAIATVVDFPVRQH